VKIPEALARTFDDPDIPLPYRSHRLSAEQAERPLRRRTAPLTVRRQVETDAAAASEPTTVPLRVRRSGSIDLDRAILALSDLSWLGRPTDRPRDDPKLRRVVTDLELPILDGSSTGPVRKAALIDLGPARRVGDRVLVEIAWRSASFAPLFPVFAGRLCISADDIVLDGRYAPPLGRLGLLLEQAMLHLVARRTAGALVARLAKEFKS
jgi:hypothetical protein